MKKVLSTVSIAALSLALFLGLSHKVLADVPWAKFVYFKNWGGINDNASTTEIEDNEATDMQNIVFDTGGVIAKRLGFGNVPSNPTFKVNVNATGITGISFYKQSSGTKHLVLIANVSGKATAYKKTYDAGGTIPEGAWTSIDYAGLPSNHTNNNIANFSVAQDDLVITLPASTPVKPFIWTGSGNVTDLTSDTDVPTCSLNAYHKNILFVSGNTTNPSRVYFSDLSGGITVWQATDFFDVSTNDNSIVRALISAFDNLYIFKDNSIFRLTGFDRDSFVLEKMVDNVGTLSQQSVKIVNNIIYFVTSQNDIAAYDGNYTVKFISPKIRTTIKANNFSRSQYAQGLAFSTYKQQDLDYYVAESTAGQGTNNQILLFDTFHEAWTRFGNMNVDSWTVADSNAGQNMMVFGDYNGLVYYYPSTVYGDVSDSCNGSNVCTTTTGGISAYYQTKWFRYPEVSKGEKYLRLVKTYITNVGTNSLQTEVRTDYQTTGSVYTYSFTNSGAQWDVAIWDTDKWPGGALTIDREEMSNKGVEMFQLKYSNNNLNESMNILGFELYVEPTDRI